MSNFYDKYQNNLIYSDTDYFILNIPLNNELIGKNIGLFKF